MPRAVKTSFVVDRVYRSTAPHNGKCAGIFYLIKTMLPGGLATVVGYNPKAPLRKFNTRTVQIKSLAHYNLELVPFSEEPDLLKSDQGRAESLSKKRPPKKLVVPEIEVGSLDHASSDLRDEIERLFNSSGDGGRKVQMADAIALAELCFSFGTSLIRSIPPQTLLSSRVEILDAPLAG